MKRIITYLFSSLVSLVTVCQINFFDWDYPRDIKDPDWYIIYDLIPEDKLFLCLYIRELENLDEQIEKFKKACETKEVFGLKGKYRLPADDPIAILIEALINISGTENALGDSHFDFTTEFYGHGIKNLLGWYRRNRTNIDLDSLSLYLAAKIYLRGIESPYNFLDPYNSIVFYSRHFHHPLNDLSEEEEEYLNRVDWDWILDKNSQKERDNIDSILARHPQNVLIARYMKKAKVAKFARMWLKSELLKYEALKWVY